MTTPSLFRTVSVRHWRKEPFRTLLVLFGIALGVAVFVSVRIANVSALEAFRSTLGVVSGPSNLIIRPVGGILPDSVFPQVWRLPGVQAAAPRVEWTVPLAAPAADRSRSLPREGSLMILGVDPFTQADLEILPKAPAAGDVAASPGGNVSANGPADTLFFTRRDGILLTDAFARRHGLEAGSTFEVLVSGRVERLTVLGVLPPGDLSRAFGGDLGVMDIANAQELLGKVGRLDRIDLHTLPKDEKRVMAAVQRRLPRGVTVGPPSERMQQAEQMVSAFQLNLTALSLISALVGVFIIYNALLISVLKRRKEIATLRSLGVTRSGIVRLFLIEAVMLGLAGTGLGLALGMWLARFTLQAVSGTINVLYLQVRARELVITPETLLLGLGLGMGAALVAGLAPALEAAATSPAETLREQTAARPTRRRALPWLLAGLGLFGLEALGTLTPGIREMKAVGFAGAFAIMLGAALLTPAFILGLGPLSQAIYQRIFGVEGSLAVHEIRAALDRSAAVIAALGIAVAMLIGLALMVGSFRQTVEVWIDGVIRADLFIGPAGQAVSGSDAVLPDAVVQAVRRLPGMAGVEAFRSRPLMIGDRQTTLSARDMAVMGRLGHLAFRRGDSREILTGIAGQNAAVVSENFARRFRVSEGDAIRLATPSGAVSLAVRGVFYDYSSDAGVLMLDRAVYARLWRDPRINNVALYLRPGVSSNETRERLIRTLGIRYNLQISNNKELRRNVLDIFDQTFALTYALEFIAVLVAMLGIGNALIAILLQRQREIGILRAVGASQGQIVALSLLEASLLATWGQIIGCVSGVMLALHLVYVINRQFFGWTLQFHITPGPFVYSYLLVLGAALLAALIPARQAARVRVSEAVRTE